MTAFPKIPHVEIPFPETPYPATPCQLPSLHLGCFGCCGRLYLGREEVLLNIHKNTKQFTENEHKKKGEGKLSLKEFCFRQKALTRSGVCANVIEDSTKKGMFVCGVHPRRNKGDEVRTNYCNTAFLCKLAQAWQEWNDAQKKAFMTFLAEKKKEGMDSFAYSMANDKDALIKEFIRL